MNKSKIVVGENFLHRHPNLEKSLLIEGLVIVDEKDWRAVVNYFSGAQGRTQYLLGYIDEIYKSQDAAKPVTKAPSIPLEVRVWKEYRSMLENQVKKCVDAGVSPSNDLLSEIPEVDARIKDLEVFCNVVKAAPEKTPGSACEGPKIIDLPTGKQEDQGSAKASKEEVFALKLKALDFACRLSGQGDIRSSGDIMRIAKLMYEFMVDQA